MESGNIKLSSWTKFLTLTSVRNFRSHIFSGGLINCRIGTFVPIYCKAYHLCSYPSSDLNINWSLKAYGLKLMSDTWASEPFGPPWISELTQLDSSQFDMGEYFPILWSSCQFLNKLRALQLCEHNDFVLPLQLNYVQHNYKKKKSISGHSNAVCNPISQTLTYLLWFHSLINLPVITETCNYLRQLNPSV